MADSLAPRVIKRINKEFNALRTHPPEGMRVIVNEDDITDVKAWIKGPAETPYAGGYFKIAFSFGPEYPAAPPRCTFSTKIFHPNVGPRGEICVNTLKKDWVSSHTLTEILTVVKCLLIYPNPESALDEEAGRLLLEKYDEYFQRAKLWTEIHGRTSHPPIEFHTLDGCDDDPSKVSDANSKASVIHREEPNTTTEKNIPPLPTSPQPFAASAQANHLLALDPKHSTDLHGCQENGMVKKRSGIEPPTTESLNTLTKEDENRKPEKPVLKPTNSNSSTKDVKDRRGRKRL